MKVTHVVKLTCSVFMVFVFCFIYIMVAYHSPAEALAQIPNFLRFAAWGLFFSGFAMVMVGLLV